MYARRKHLTTGRVIYVVSAFPSSVPGKTQSAIDMITVVDKPRAAAWMNYSAHPRQFPGSPKTPVLFFNCTHVPIHTGGGSRYGQPYKVNPLTARLERRSIDDMSIGVIRKNTCRRAFLKLKHALAYHERIMARCFNAQELRYIAWNDKYKGRVGHN